MWAEFVADWNKLQESIKEENEEKIKKEAEEKINFTFVSEKINKLKKEKTMMAICAGTLAVLIIPFALEGVDKIPFASGLGLTSLISLYHYDQARTEQKKLQKILKK